MQKVNVIFYKEVHNAGPEHGCDVDGHWESTVPSADPAYTAEPAIACEEQN